MDNEEGLSKRGLEQILDLKGRSTKKPFQVINLQKYLFKAASQPGTNSETRTLNKGPL